MAASTSPFVFSGIVLKVAGAALNGLKSAELVINQELGETVAATPTTWTDYCKGFRDWQVNFSGGWIETNPECGLGSSLKFDGATNWKGYASATVNCTATMTEVSSQNSAGVREFLPGRRTVTVDFEGIYYDHAGTGAAWATAYNNVAEGTTSVSLVLSWGTGSSITFTGYCSSLSIVRADNDAVRMSGTINATGTVTDGTAGQATIDSLFDAGFMDEGSIATEFSTTSALNTEYTGTSYVSSFNISVPLSGQIEYSGTLQGTGALVDALGS